MPNREAWTLPQIPLSPIDMINRMAAATGSVGYAQATAHGDYNGHHVMVSFKPHAVSGPTWNAEYWWAGRVVLGRGSFQRCVEAAVREYRRGARGTSVVAEVYDDEAAAISADEQRQILQQAGFERVEKDDPATRRAPWWTGAHEAVCDAAAWQRTGFASLLMERALAFTGTPEEWPAERDRLVKERLAQNRAEIGN